MAPTPSKIAKIDSAPGKLWTNEDRLFMEKVFYLNKSTTKYLIVGIEPHSFEHVIRICDRSTGTHINIKKDQFHDFMRIVESVLEHHYTLDSGVLRESGDLTGIKFSIVSNVIWRLSQIDQPHASILIHQSSFKTLVRISRLIVTRIHQSYENEACKTVIEGLRGDTFGMDQKEIIEELYGQTTKYSTTCVEYQVISDLITNMESYARLSEFGEGFYFRCNYKKPVNG